MAINIKGMSKAQLGDLVKRAQARQSELSKGELMAARKKVQNIAKEGGFDLNDLIGRSPSTNSNQKSVAKFRNPSDAAQTWSGRGKRPHWFNAALASGKTQQDLMLH